VAGRCHYHFAHDGGHKQNPYLWIRLPLPVTGRIVVRRMSFGVKIMVEKKEPEAGSAPEEGHNDHPVEPAEGAREPGEDADQPQPPHPDEPAEGER
jgi:hypothetical protein